MSKSLYKLSTTGAIQVWDISGDAQTGEITIQYGQMNGAMQTQVDQVKTNNSGRSMREQILLEMRSRITRQKAKGYRDTVDEARSHVNLNALNLDRPMLAQRFDKVPKFDVTNCYRQFKYDGHRMLVHNTGRELVAYTRNGKIIDTLDHILRHIDIPRGYTLDGEVYYHGVPLQTVASWCKRVQPETLKLEYVVYDTILPTEYGRRYEELRDFNLRGPIRLAETWKTDRPIPEDLHDSIEKGYEGLILRSGRLPYGAGKRCKSLIKVKKAYDDEFLVVDVEESRDGWGVLVCKTLFNKEFRVSAPGTIPEKTAILMNKHQYIGMWVTVEYFSLTKDGIPFHPVAINFRDNYSE